MSDESAKHFEEETPTIASQQSVQRSITLSITLHPDGQLELSGPLQNKVLVNGLLGAAQQEVHRLHFLNELKQMSQAPNGGGLNGLLKKMGRG